jgi:hypothetical protein
MVDFQMFLRGLAVPTRTFAPHCTGLRVETGAPSFASKKTKLSQSPVAAPVASLIGLGVAKVNFLAK